MAEAFPWKTHSLAKEIEQFLCGDISPQNGDMLIIIKQLADVYALLEEYHEKVNNLDPPKNVIIFGGIPEMPRENAIEVIMDFLRIFLRVNVPPFFLKYCFRFGDMVPRKIAVLCKFQEVFQEIWERKNIFNNSVFSIEMIDKKMFEKALEEPQSSANSCWENPDSGNTEKKL